jgi:hypothetical protein
LYREQDYSVGDLSHEFSVYGLPSDNLLQAHCGATSPTIAVGGYFTRVAPNLGRGRRRSPYPAMNSRSASETSPDAWSRRAHQGFRYVDGTDPVTRQSSSRRSVFAWQAATGIFCARTASMNDVGRRFGRSANFKTRTAARGDGSWRRHGRAVS